MDLIGIVLLCAALFGGSFLGGLVPLNLKLARVWQQLINTAGVGLLVGTAFVVIIPEGSKVVFRARASAGQLQEYFEHHHSAGHATGPPTESWARDYMGHALVFGFVFMLLVDRLSGGHSHHGHGHGHGPRPVAPRLRTASSASSPAADGIEDGEDDDEMERAMSTDRLLDPTAMGSPALGSGDHGPAKVSPSSLEAQGKAGTARRLLARLRGHGNQLSESARRGAATVTFSVVVHCAVDGIALGAISAAAAQNQHSGGGEGGHGEDSAPLEWIVFLAIILHKIPSAFGLSALLLQQGRPHREIRRHLLAFSAAAPVCALLSYLVLRAAAAAGDDGFWAAGADAIPADPAAASPAHAGHASPAASEVGSGSNPASFPVDDSHEGLMGLALLFSGGTFLYTIAVHILPHLEPGKGESGEPSLAAPDSHHPHDHGMVQVPLKGAAASASPHHHPAHGGPEAPANKWLDLGALVGGMLLPLFLSMGHSH